MHISKAKQTDKTAANLATTELARDGYHQRLSCDAKMLNLVGLGAYTFVTQGRGDTVWNQGNITLVVRGGKIIPRL